MSFSSVADAESVLSQIDKIELDGNVISASIEKKKRGPKDKDGDMDLY